MGVATRDESYKKHVVSEFTEFQFSACSVLNGFAFRLIFLPYESFHIAEREWFYSLNSKFKCQARLTQPFNFKKVDKMSFMQATTGGSIFYMTLIRGPVRSV